MIELGGHIELVGFKDLDGGSMVIVKKMVGNHVKKLNSMTQNFEKLTLSLKRVGGEDSNKFEIHAKLIDNGQPIVSEVTDFNLFYTLDKVLQKINSAVSR